MLSCKISFGYEVVYRDYSDPAFPDIILFSNPCVRVLVLFDRIFQKAFF